MERRGESDRLCYNIWKNNSPLDFCFLERGFCSLKSHMKKIFIVYFISLLIIMPTTKLELQAQGDNYTYPSVDKVEYLKNRIALGNLGTFVINKNDQLTAWGYLPKWFCMKGKSGMQNGEDCIFLSPQVFDHFGKVKYVQSQDYQGSIINQKGDMYIWNTSYSLENIYHIGRLKNAEQVIVYPDGQNLSGIVLKTDGSVWSWISNGGSFAFKKMNELSGITKIRSGRNLSGQTYIALKNDGTLWAWGDLSILWSEKYKNKQDGIWYKNQHAGKPVQLKNLPLINDFEFTNNGIPLMTTFHHELWTYVGTEYKLVVIPGKVSDHIISIFESSNFVIDSKGRVMEWNDNLKELEANDILSSRDFIFIEENSSFYEWFAVGITKNGELYGWGNNQYGQLGLGVPLPIPSVPHKLDRIKNPKMVSSSSDHVLAVSKDGFVYGWGNNQYNQINASKQENVLLPVKLDLNSVKKVETGFWFSLALTESGELYGWGKIENIGYSSNSEIPIPLRQIKEKIIDISAYDRSAVVLTESGKVYQMGGVNYNFDDETLPLIRKIAIDDVQSISAGNEKSYALKKDGTVWWWGTLVRRGEIKAKHIVGLEQIVDISSASVNHDYLIAVGESGEAFGWGDNTARQIGFRTPSIMYSPTDITHEARMFSKSLQETGLQFHSVSAGSSFVLYISNENKLYQTGFYKDITYVDLLNDIIFAEAGAGNLYWINGGSLYAFGDDNSEGQLGNGTIEFYEHPQWIEFGQDLIKTEH